MTDIQFSSLAKRLKRSEIRELLKLTRKPDIISFGGGLPDPALFPYDAVKEAAKCTLEDMGNLALQYSPTEGDPFFKEQISLFMQRQGEKANPDNILVVSSSQQGLDLLAKIFIDRKDPVIVEMPTYVGALQAFRMLDPEIHGVEMDYNGIIPDQLKEKIVYLMKMGRKPKFLYLIPDFQNPSGITLSLARRKQVLDFASRYDLIIIEDSPYRELRFKGEILPSLYSLDTEDRVIYTKTFSKIFCPGFRIGWMIGPEQIIEKLVIAKQGTDLCTSAFVSIVSAYIIKNAYLENQIEKSKKLYAKKSKVMLDALDQYMPELDGLSWSKPEGGMFLWIKLPEYMNTEEMLYEAVRQNVAYVIGSAFFHDGSGGNTMRVNYSYPSEEQIITGIRRLSELVRKQQASRSVSAF
jgi:2-aminoadipate transaminase